MRKKTYEIDRVLEQHRAEQDMGGFVYEVQKRQELAQQAADELAAVIGQQDLAESFIDDKTRILENQKKALDAAGGINRLLQLYQEATKALAEVGAALEKYQAALDAAGGMDRFMERHKMFMAAAREFSPIFTIEPGKRFGKPCIRGIRMTIHDVLEYQTSGMTDAEILHDFSNLTQEDLDVCRAFGAYMEERFKSIES